MNNKYIWKDSVDPKMIHFGVKYKDTFTIWFSVFIDAISEMFGDDIYSAILELPQGQPKEIDRVNIEF